MVVPTPSVTLLTHTNVHAHSRYFWTSIVVVLIPQLMMQKYIKLMTCECLTVDESALDEKREAQNLLFCCFRRSTGRSLLRYIGEQNLKVLVIFATIMMAVGLVMFLTEIKNRTGQSDTAGLVLLQLVVGYVSQPINDFFTVFNPSVSLLKLCLFCELAKTLPIRDAEDLVGCEVEIYDPLSSWGVSCSYTPGSNPSYPHSSKSTSYPHSQGIGLEEARTDGTLSWSKTR